MTYNYPIDFKDALETFITQALKEDLGSGDVSGMACLNSYASGTARCIVKQ